MNSIPSALEFQMNAFFPMSLQRAPHVPMRPDLATFTQGDALVRRGRVIALATLNGDGDSCASLFGHLPDGLHALERSVIRSPAHSVISGGDDLLLTYVLRHSPGGLQWLDSLGRAAQLPPGALFVSQARHDAMLELSAASLDEPCDCVQWRLQTDQAVDLQMRVAPDDAIFCNSHEACVRVLLGRYQAQGADAAQVAQVNLLDIDLAPQSELELPVAGNRLAIALLATGSLVFEAEVIEAPCAIAFSGTEPLVQLATQEGTSLLWLEWFQP